ncbi:MAG: hypothetical protein Q8R69_18810, partial [Telluria sp.]|nr:hypothetical protein [Telluria sp.]
MSLTMARIEACTAASSGPHGPGVFDHVAKVGVVVLADRGVHRYRLFHGLQDSAYLVFRQLHLVGQRSRTGHHAALGLQLARDAVHHFLLSSPPFRAGEERSRPRSELQSRSGTVES